MSEAKHCVLVVEDDPVILEALGWHLRRADYEPVLAEDGEKGWSLLEREPDRYIAVLLDRTMPRMDGMEVLRRMKAHHELQNLPVILETALAERRDVVEGLEAGAYYYLTKPFDKKTLLAIVRTAVSDQLRYRKLRDDARRAVGSFSHMVKGVYAFRTIPEGRQLAALLARCYSDPEKIVFGLSELMTNAVEHGNLGLTYEDKSRLLAAEEWESEVDRRLASPEQRDRKVTVEVECDEGETRFRIRDEGEGFEWKRYLDFDPERAFDIHGRGIALAREMSFDRVDYHGKGNEVTASVRETGDRARLTGERPR